MKQEQEDATGILKDLERKSIESQARRQKKRARTYFTMVFAAQSQFQARQCQLFESLSLATGQWFLDHPVFQC